MTGPTAHGSMGVVIGAGGNGTRERRHTWWGAHVHLLLHLVLEFLQLLGLLLHLSYPSFDSLQFLHTEEYWYISEATLAVDPPPTSTVPSSPWRAQRQNRWRLARHARLFKHPRCVVTTVCTSSAALEVRTRGNEWFNGVDAQREPRCEKAPQVRPQQRPLAANREPQSK